MITLPYKFYIMKPFARVLAILWHNYNAVPRNELDKTVSSVYQRWDR